MSSEQLSITERTRVKRGHKRASFDRKTLYEILDATLLCHVGYLRDGKPAVIPTVQWREGDHIYWHGSSASRALKNAVDEDVCLSVTHLDGLILARSAFHHSVNYRSAVIYGKATKVTDPDIKAEKLQNMVEKIMPGRWPHLRPMTATEVKATMVLSMPIEEASAKIRTGGPIDDDEDYELPIWAGIVPIHGVMGQVEADPRNLDGLEIPEHVSNLLR